ncbi:MAG: GlsB/YeaQ/YmgE family stress response membrane protein [Gemmatimonadaceae bacterium]
MDLLWWLIVGIIAGWLTGKIMKGSGYGVLMDLVLGVIGAFIGGFVMRTLGFAGAGGLLYSIVVATLGAVLLVWLVRLVTGRRTTTL